MEEDMDAVVRDLDRAIRFDEHGRPGDGAWLRPWFDEHGRPGDGAWLRPWQCHGRLDCQSLTHHVQTVARPHDAHETRHRSQHIHDVIARHP
eukprot:6862052-Pyramimonas_sp.AAC.1